MPEESTTSKTASPMLALIIAIIIAGLMVIVSTVVCLNSGAYTTVKQIQSGSKLIRSIDLDKDGIDTSTPIKASDIDAYSASIKQRLQSLDDNTDFGPGPVSDASLGLR